MPAKVASENVKAGEAALSSDPTALTTDALLRAVADLTTLFDAKCDVIRQRLDGMDKATELLEARTTAMPTEVDKQVGHLASLVDERFMSIAKQFDERDKRGERESRDNKVAVDAAFAAQKEAAAKQDQANSKAIDKSEATTTETIKTNADLSKAEIRAISDKIDDIKERLTLLEGRDQGKDRNVATTQTNANLIVLIIVAVTGIIFGAAGLIVAFVKH